MKVANTNFNRQGYYTEPTLDVDVLRNPKCVDLFDQNGYHLTKAEQAFLIPNGYDPIERRHEDCLRQDWIISDKEKKHTLITQTYLKEKDSMEQLNCN